MEKPNTTLPDAGIETGISSSTVALGPLDQRGRAQLKGLHRAWTYHDQGGVSGLVYALAAGAKDVYFAFKLCFQQRKNDAFAVAGDNEELCK